MNDHQQRTVGEQSRQSVCCDSVCQAGPGFVFLPAFLALINRTTKPSTYSLTPFLETVHPRHTCEG